MAARKRTKRSWASDGLPYKDEGDDVEILPCPWCGKVPKLRRYAMFDTREMRYGIWCNNGNDSECPMVAVETLPFKTKKEAIEAWNRRSPA